MTDKTVTVVAKDDGIIELTAAPGAESLAYRIADLLKRGADATNLNRSGGLRFAY
jgi:hypothetical protein